MVIRRVGKGAHLRAVPTTTPMVGTALRLRTPQVQRTRTAPLPTRQEGAS